jgi:spermidine/putrescine transport system permease protein
MRAFKNALFERIGCFFSLPAFLWQLFFLWLPLAIIVAASFYSRSIGVTFEFYREVLTSAHMRIIVRSLLLAFGTACACLVVSYPVVYFISFRASRWKNMLIFLLTLPFWVNFLVHAYSWFFVLDRNGILNKALMALHVTSSPIHILNTLKAVAIVMFHAYLPYMVLPLYNIFEKFDLRLIEASMDLGASRRETFWRVTFPLTATGAKLGFFLVFGMAFGEYVIPQLMIGDKSFFVGTLISDYFILSRQFAVGAAFTCVSACVLVMLMMVSLLGFKALKKGVR